jgi:DNA polymerase III delta subunit
MLCAGAMGQDRAAASIERIERALVRIEAAAGRASRDDGLRQAHAALRGKVEGAIAQIDRLLETEGSR